MAGSEAVGGEHQFQLAWRCHIAAFYVDTCHFTRIPATGAIALKIALIALPNVQMLDVSGPLDVFAQANLEAGREVYALHVLACGAGPVRSSSGVRLLADGVLGKTVETFDTVLVAGAPNAPDLHLKPALRQALVQLAHSCRRFGSVCTGAFALAQCGLLDGQRVTTHWAVAQQLAERYPALSVEADALYVVDGKLRTSAGVTAGLDLALALVQEDLGRDLAAQVAAQLVMYFKRPGGQLQFSRNGQAQVAGRSVLQEIQRWAAANPSADLTVAALAQRAGMSPRHFARLFQAEVGVTPAAWVEASRVTAARELLEQGASAPKAVAASCGFRSADTLRRAFIRHVGVTPAQYRRYQRGG